MQVAQQSYRAIPLAGLLLLAASLMLVGCSGKQEAPKPAATAPTATTPTATALEPSEIPLPPSTDIAADLPEGVRAVMNEPFKGDLDEMVKRRLVRVGVTYGRTNYFVDKGVQRGVAYEYAKLAEDELNKARKTGNLRVIFWCIPLPRNQLLPALLDGKVDFVLAQATIRPDLAKLVDFTNPTRTDISELVVTGPGAPAIASVDDLSGQEVFVRKTSNYYQSLLELNRKLESAGKAPVSIQLAPEELEDDDLLEMTNAGLIKITIVKNYLANFWKQVLPNITVHDTVAVRTGGQEAVVVRKGSPQLEKGLNYIIDKHGLGTAFGNMMAKRYLQNTKYVKDALSESERQKLLAMVDLFKKYSDQYEMDYLLMAAQGYQESQLDQSVKSRVGAVGVMQVMPATGKELNVGDISQIEPNINAGVKYMRWMIDRYYKDEPMDNLNKGLFAFASYNAGPARIRQLRKEAAARGLDPNVWFGNVEQIASERIGRETVTYVSNIYKYYVAYKLVVAERQRRAAAKEEVQQSVGGKPNS
jgi:membrane-bound lytic murein transglycosylase MltF